MNNFDSSIDARTARNIDPEIDAQDFVKKAFQKGAAEIEAAHTALEKSVLNQVKEFAEKMIREHGEANQKLRLLAAHQGLEVEEDASLLDKARKIALEIRTGESFDQAYINNQVSEHEKVIELFEKGTQTNNEHLCEFAMQTLPALHQHLNQARQIQASIS